MCFLVAGTKCLLLSKYDQFQLFFSNTFIIYSLVFQIISQKTEIFVFNFNSQVLFM